MASSSSDSWTFSIDPEKLLSYKFPEATFTYTERDVAVYALGIGACARDALDEKELKRESVWDAHKCSDMNLLQPYPETSFLQVLPTFLASFTSGTALSLHKLPGMQFDPRLLLHGQQYIEIYKPFPSSACVQNRTTIVGLHDKGKATVVEIETASYEKSSGDALCMNRSTVYLHGAGGFSELSPPYSYSNFPAGQVLPVKIPKHQPFTVYEDCTQQSQALLYRLSGDYNRLHSDPMIAEAAGFSRPILHGLCTLGFAVRAIIKSLCNGELTMVKGIFGRFLLHVYPGETLITEMWLEGSRVMFQTKVKERNRAVLVGYVVLDHSTSSP